ncbi:unnamed protein product [Oikopleura dioica]|uniref:Peptidase M16 C-terminal domain-containing protein n=1 Tax=Oikopleura dioica TaxID=34765 RepID=E4X255_OIKDI|nr:unnamed protein product [Oikopleura dioica]
MLGTVVKTIQFATLNEVADDCTTLQASADGVQSGLSTADVTDNEDVLSDSETRTSVIHAVEPPSISRFPTDATKSQRLQKSNTTRFFFKTEAGSTTLTKTDSYRANQRQVTNKTTPPRGISITRIREFSKLVFTEATLPSGRTDHYANFWGADTPFHSCEIRHHKPGSDTLVGCVTYPICGWSHSDCLTMNLIAKLIGVFMHGSGGFQFFTSPFVKKMQALDQSSTFKAYMSLYNDKGLFGFIFTAFELDKASAIVDAFHEELERIATALSDEELSNAKRSLFTDICLGIDGTQPVADEIGRHLLVYNRRIHYPETEYLIENISREDVKRCVTQIIDSKEKCIALLGNLDHTPPVFPDVPQINDPEKVHEEAFCKNIITARK